MASLRAIPSTPVRSRDEQVHPDYDRLCRAYELIYRSGKPQSMGLAKGFTPSTFESPRLAQLARQFVAIAHNDYTEAMWQRRAWLHEQGRDGGVYDGTDALDWLVAHRGGRTGVPIPAFRRASSSAKPAIPHNEGLEYPPAISDAVAGLEIGTQKGIGGGMGS